MYPEPITRYLVPQTCREAAAFKSAHPEAVFLAGGQSLLPQLKSRVRRAATIIDLNRVTDAVACTIDERELRLAALVRYRDVIGNGAIGEHFPALHDAIREIGDRQVRNRGTPVGSLAHADPTGDIAPVALVFDGVLETADADDARTIVPFDPATVAALPFIAAVTLCRRGGSAFVKHNRVAQDRAIVNVAAALDLDDAHLCRNVRVAVGGIAPYAMRLAAVEYELEGTRPDAAAIAALGEAAAAALDPQDDVLATGAYRRALVRTGVVAVVRAAIGRAGGTVA